jgi:hypothetical protein
MTSPGASGRRCCGTSQARWRATARARRSSGFTSLGPGRTDAQAHARVAGAPAVRALPRLPGPRRGQDRAHDLLRDPARDPARGPPVRSRRVPRSSAPRRT